MHSFLLVSESLGGFRFLRVWNASSGSDSYLGLDASQFTFTNLVLTGLGYHKSVSSNIFAWGNAFFFSPNHGKSVLFARTFTSPLILFDGSSTGEYIIQLMDNQVKRPY